MFMLIRREALDEVGLLDEAYFLYAEEADLCFRFARAGWRRVFTPAARIIHVGGGSQSGDTHEVNTRMYIQLQKSILIFLKKNRGMGSWLSAKAIYIVSDAIRAAGLRVMSLGRGDDRLRERAGAASAALRYHLFGTGPTT
jgi:GT2 family glycosyltransferase